MKLKKFTALGIMKGKLHVESIHASTINHAYYYFAYMYTCVDSINNIKVLGTCLASGKVVLEDHSYYKTKDGRYILKSQIKQ